MKLISYNKKYISEGRLDNVKPNRTFRAFSSYHCQTVDLAGDSFKVRSYIFHWFQKI